MPRRFSERILDFLQQPEYQPVEVQRLARSMGIAEEEHGDFREAVDALRRVGRVVLGTGSSVMLPQPRGQIAGTYRANPRGFGFVVPEEPTVHGDLFIPPGASLDAVTGDTVLCRVVRRGKREGKIAFGGQIIQVLRRGRNRFVGRLSREGGIWFVQPDGHALHVPILIADPGAKSAKADDQVVVEIIQYPSEGRPAKGVIVERLGKTGELGVDLLSIVRQFQLPDAFPDAVLAEATAVSSGFDADAAGEGREDLSGMTIVTIDPADARDFDDAISLTRLGDDVGRDEGKHGARYSRNRSGAAGRRGPNAAAESGALRRGRGSRTEAVWELGVHIADVSTFVRPGGEIDEEARVRGTSVYFPRHVIPMLPEVLSNGLCSLQEGEPRFCKSAFIRYDAAGRVLGARFANTVIRSSRRLTYEQASAVLEGKAGKSAALEGKTRKARKLLRDADEPRASVRAASPAGGGETAPKGLDAAVVGLLHEMETLARAIRKRRLDDGMIVLDMPEVELELNDEGRMIDAHPADTSFSHTIIEMFMVEANEAVARLLDGLGLPFLRRVHGEPDETALEAMARMVRAAGYPVPKQLTPGDLQGLLDSVRGRPEGFAISLAVLKSMQLAEYSPEAIGHFALASTCYAHFTSPIRRYTDLMIHRLLEMHLSRRGRAMRATADGAVPSYEELREMGRRLSCASRQAESAEREYKTIKILQYLEGHTGESFEGVVTGITNFGMFVQHPRLLIDGLLRYEDMAGDWWDVDVRIGRVVGERTHQSFAMGSKATVRIASVDMAGRQLTLALVEEPAGKKSRVRRETDGREGGGRVVKGCGRVSKGGGRVSKGGKPVARIRRPSGRSGRSRPGRRRR